MMKFVREYGVLIAFVVLFAVNAMRHPDVVLTPEFIRNIFNQNAAIGLMAVGMTFVILTAGIDLSVGSLMAFSAAVGVSALNRQAPGSDQTAIAIAVAATMGTGALAGLFNGVIISYGRVIPFVTTLIGLLAFRSLAQEIGDGGEIRVTGSQLFQNLGSEGVHLGTLVIQWPILFWIAMSLLGSLLLNYTVWGRHVIAVGANEKAARYSGVAVSRVKMAAYAFAGLCVGVAGLSAAARLNSVSTGQMGLYGELDAIAAVVLGGTSLRGGSGRLWGTFVGVLLLGLINNMMVVEGISPELRGAAKGLIILVAVLLQREKTP